MFYETEKNLAELAACVHAVLFAAFCFVSFFSMECGRHEQKNICMLDGFAHRNGFFMVM